MKKKLIMLGLALSFLAVPCIAAPGGHGAGPSVRAANYHGGGMHRPPMHASVTHRVPPHHHHMAGRPLPPPPIYRPYRPMYRPYYYSYYPTTYYTTSYSYYPSYSYEVVEPMPATVNTVVVRDNYAGLNTAANVINAAANVAATIRYLTW